MKFYDIKINIYESHLRRIESAVEAILLQRSISPIGDAIKEIAEKIDSADLENEDPFFVDAFLDDETESIEELLGAAFVICQTYITGVVSRVCRLHQHIPDNGLPISWSKGKKADSIRICSHLLGDTEYTQVEVIDALANYFKHRDQWPHEWKSKDKLWDMRKKTVEILASIDISGKSNGNLRAGSEALENKDYYEVAIFTDILQEWAEKLVERYRVELKSRKLI